MPLIEVKLVEKVLTDAQKKRVIHDLTEAMVAIEGENLRPYTVVILEEVKTGDWAVGGEPFTTESVRTLAAGVIKSGFSHSSHVPL